MADSGARKRLYRHRVTCSECGKELDSDYAESHRKKHPGKKVKYTAPIDKSQRQLTFFTQTSQRGDDPAPCTSKSTDDLEIIKTGNQLNESLASEQQEVHIASMDVEEPVVNSDVSFADVSDEDDTVLQLTTSEPTLSGKDNINEGPNQPVLPEYFPKTFGRETSKRDLNSDWFKIYPWLDYDVVEHYCTCFACKVFLNETTFRYDNWKKTVRLVKHSKSKRHQFAMAKWLAYRANLKKQTSVLTQLSNEHSRQVKENREYLKVIIECLIFTAQQNIAQRGHCEDRSSLDCPSEINRGNFLELLHLRCTDIPWLSQKIVDQSMHHIQWISPDIQNELIEIVAQTVLSKIAAEVRCAGCLSVIIDETTDISRLEQVSICLRYVYQGITKETFVGFYETASTDGESLYKLVKDVFTDMQLNLSNIVGQCFDGASNMTGKNKGLAARMLETSPTAIYVHCYGHLLNLAVQDTMTDTEVLRNALGTIQSLYNFIEASPKRHAVFESIDGGDKTLSIVLKSQSKTRWTCRFEAVKAVDLQMPRIIACLLKLTEERDSKTYSDSCALLNAICDFNFVFGLCLLKIILSMTSSLSSYLQSETMNVITAKKTADMTIKTIAECRSDEAFESLWERAVIVGNSIKDCISDTRFSFKDAKIPRQRKASRRLQALVGEAPDDDENQGQTVKDYFRVSGYFSGIDRVIAELKNRFNENEQSILCALGDIVLNKIPEKTNFDIVGEHYTIDTDLLENEKKIFVQFLENISSDTENDTELKLNRASDIVEFMHSNDLTTVLPIFLKVATILSTIPATSCSAERSFSALRRIKTYLRNTMKQSRLNSLAVLNIERQATNSVMAKDINSVIDTFGGRKNRAMYLF